MWIAKQVASKFKPLKDNSGYTLIEMAIALVVIGLLLGSGMQAYSTYKRNEQITTTQVNLEQAVSKLQTYRRENGFYPCPSPVSAARTDAAYGVPTDCSDVTQAANTCTAGICIEEGVRTDLGYTPRVRVGAIPFRTLQMDEKETFDGYGSRLLYALTERQGVLATFAEKEGGINVVDENGQNLIDPVGSASFIIISHGQDRIGAYDKLGNNSIVCGGAGLQLENCRDPVSAPPYPAVYAMSKLSLAGDVNDFDDVVQYFSASEIPLWRRTNVTAEDILDTTNGNVGIGENAPTRTMSIAQSTVATNTGDANYRRLVTTNRTSSGDESGALRLSGSMRADNYCELGGTSCFKPKNIAGDNDTADPTSGMTCPAGLYMVGVSGNGTDAQPICEEVKVTCPVGQVITGLNASGAPICGPVLNTCPAATRTVCSANDVSLPANSAHGTQQAFVKGDCRNITYRCNNGTWDIYASSGTCTDSTTVTTVTNSCGNGYSGTYTTTSSTCTGTTNNWATVCPTTCTGYSDPQTQNCTAPNVGTQSRTVTYTCDASGNLVGSATPWNPPCSCGLSDVYQFDYCPSGYTRASSPSPATFPSTGPAPGAAASSWPATASMGKWRLNTVSGCAYTNPPYDSSNCTCDLTPKYETELHIWPACDKAKTGSRATGTPLGTVDYKFDVVKYDMNPATCTKDMSTRTVVSAAESTPRIYAWKDLGQIPTAPTATNPGYNKLNDTNCSNCTAPTPNGTCVSPIAGMWYYYNCACQEQ